MLHRGDRSRRRRIVGSSERDSVVTSPCCAADAQFGRPVAAGDLKRYRRRGPDPSTRLLLQELRPRIREGASLLDVGGGVGVIGVELLARGLGAVTQVDASSAYLDTARRHFAERNWQDRVELVQGDFATVPLSRGPADLVTLDRVVCCYPDFEGILVRAAEHTRHALGFSYPRDRWYVRWVVGLGNLLRRVTGSTFRTFVHSVPAMTRVVETAGLRHVARHETMVWAVDIYERP